MEYIANTFGNLLQQTAFVNLTWGNFIISVPGDQKRL